MSIKEKINEDFMSAFKNKDMARKNFLGVVKGEIQNEVGRSGKDDDATVLGILKKMEKSLKQTNTEEALKELTYLTPYMPATMPDDEIRTIVKEILTREGTTKNIGFVMGVFNKEQNGKSFDNKVVAQIIKEELT